jgi:hypothetical protein
VNQNISIVSGAHRYICAQYNTTPIFNLPTPCTGQIVIQPDVIYCNNPLAATFSNTNVCIGQIEYTYNMVLDGVPPFAIGFSGPYNVSPWEFYNYQVIFKIDSQIASLDTTFIYTSDTVIPITVNWVGSGFQNYGLESALGMFQTFNIQVSDSSGSDITIGPIPQIITNCGGPSAVPFNPEKILAYAGPAATEEEACIAWRAGGNDTTLFIDDIWAIAYGLYQNPAMTLYAPESMYSDGIFSRYWNGTEFIGSPAPCSQF